MANRVCLYCRKGFAARHPSQKFCPKNRAGRHLCKDRYHNIRRFVCGNISEARKQYISEDSDPRDSIHPFSSEAFEP